MKLSAPNRSELSFVDNCLCPWRWLLGIALLSVLVVFVDAELGWRAVFIKLHDVEFNTIILALLLFIGSHVLRAHRIYKLLSQTINTSLLSVAKLSAWHQAANNILPMRIGELALPLLLNRYYGTGWSIGISRLLWLRLFDVLCMGTVVLMIFALYSIKLVTVILMTGILIFSICAFFVKTLSRISIVDRFIRTARETSPQSTMAFCELFLITVAAWTCKLCAIALAIKAVSDLSLTAALSGGLGAEVTSLLPIHGLAGAGTFEAGFIGFAQLFEDSTAELIAASVAVHIFVLLSTCTLALVLSPVSMSHYTTAESS